MYALWSCVIVFEYIWVFLAVSPRGGVGNPLFGFLEYGDYPTCIATSQKHVP